MLERLRFIPYCCVHDLIMLSACNLSRCSKECFVNFSIPMGGGRKGGGKAPLSPAHGALGQAGAGEGRAAKLFLAPGWLL